MKRLFFLWSFFTPLWLISQHTDTTISELPFPIDDSKRLPEFERAEKKEGLFLTGLPRFEFDPIRGFGLGGNVNMFQNGTSQDPFFNYTAYRHKINAEFFLFQNGRFRYALSYDAPYVFNSKWRIRADVVHWEDPNAQYWGIGRTSLNPLGFRNKRTGGFSTYAKVKDYEENLTLAELGSNGEYYTDHHFHHMEQREQLYNITGERVFWEGKLRLVCGMEALFTSFSSYRGKIAEEAFDLNGMPVQARNRETLIDQEIEDGTWKKFNLSGFTNGGPSKFTSILASALIYDTRDFEPDPSEGLLFQYSQEFSSPIWGSQFRFQKFMLQGQYIHTFKRWNQDKGRITFAGLAAAGHLFGSNINFIEMWDLSSQAEAGGILVLGGSRSLRGYREARFLAPTVALVNLEMRIRLHDFNRFKQHFSIGLTPFYDFGSVWNSPKEMNVKDWRGAPGIGGRMAWNQSTILRLDVAQSREGSQIFFGFGHIF